MARGQRAIVERIVPEADLAWSLAEAAKPHLCADECRDIFMAIGAGETFAAIRQLFNWVAIRGIPVGLDLVERCTTWLHAYAGHEDERYLRRLVEKFLTPLPEDTFIRIDRARRVEANRWGVQLLWSAPATGHR